MPKSHPHSRHREQQRRSRICPCRAAYGTLNKGRVVSSVGQQGGPHPLELGNGTPSAPFPSWLAAAMARSIHPSHHLSSHLPLQSLARCSRCYHGYYRARNTRIFPPQNIVYQINRVKNFTFSTIFCFFLWLLKIKNIILLGANGRKKTNPLSVFFGGGIFPFNTLWYR